jgi:hypothetical protein
MSETPIRDLLNARCEMRRPKVRSKVNFTSRIEFRELPQTSSLYEIRPEHALWGCTHEELEKSIANATKDSLGAFVKLFVPEHATEHQTRLVCELLRKQGARALVVVGTHKERKKNAIDGQLKSLHTTQATSVEQAVLSLLKTHENSPNYEQLEKYILKIMGAS